LVNGPNWQCCLAGSSKKAPRILIFSIVLGAEYSFNVKSIATYAPPKVNIIINSFKLLYLFKNWNEQLRKKMKA
jgi:hypothetical protein